MLDNDVVSFGLDGKSAIALPDAVAIVTADNRIAMRFMVVPFCARRYLMQLDWGAVQLECGRPNVV
jgi:hypothetical protein